MSRHASFGGFAAHSAPGPFRRRSRVCSVGSGAGLLETAQIRSTARNPCAPVHLDRALSRNAAYLAATLARSAGKSSLAPSLTFLPQQRPDYGGDLGFVYLGGYRRTRPGN